MKQIKTIDPSVFQARRRRNGIYFGVLAGLAFALGTWGSDNFLLFQSHAYLPWFKLAAGAGFCILIGALAGWLTAKVDNALAGVFFWLVSAVAFILLANWLAYTGFRWALSLFHPQISSLVDYSPNLAANYRVGISILATGLAGVIAGLFELPVVDSATTTASQFVRWLTLGISLPIFLLAGIAGTDALINEPLRTPVVNLNSLLEFAQENQGRQVDPQTSRDMHLGALGSLGETAYQPYRLQLKGFDDSQTMAYVLAQFGSRQAICVMISDVPSYCSLPGAEAPQSAPAGGETVSLEITPSTPSPKPDPETTNPPPSQAGDGAPSQALALLPEEWENADSAETLNFYDISVSLDPVQNAFSGSMAVDYTNRENAALSSLYFRLLPNGDSSYGNGSLRVQDVRAGGQEVETLLSGRDTILEIPLPKSLLPGESTRIEMGFEGQIPVDFGGAETPEGYGIFNSSDQVTTLANWFPILAVYDSDGWNFDPVSGIGDSVYSDMAAFQVAMEVPADQVVITTGVEVSNQTSGDTRQSVYVSGPARDFFMILSPRFQVSSKAVNGTQVNSYYLPGDEAVGREMLSVGGASLEIYNERLGKYPYSELDIVEAPLRNALGVEFPGIVLIGSRAYQQPSRPETATTVAHEVAHQWWYNLVGNDVFDEPWLDEALASYTSSLYFEDTFGPFEAAGLFDYYDARHEASVRDGKDDLITNSLSHFEELDDPGVYGAIVYAKGALFFRALRQEIGDQAFFQALQNYYQTYRYQIATGKDLLDSFETAAGRSLDDFYQKWLFTSAP